ncbi:hypothetical protein [Nocardioides sp. Arc9.136]|uniref:hypothetical protein n=1 Tax=Nocardioides sp. Arc9.136 TaxID=2996826 RepID=UPI0026650335|nr:hypothetical protein [Nocardioides sp. Arc9.136]WKN47101.1 hypothetical protein OSR43_13745 [Nocardioides sp. Arc9.136]
MSPVWKYLLGLAVALPVGGYVAGSLVASSADDPAPREVIVIEDAPSSPPSPGTTLSTRPSRSASPSPDDDGTGDRSGSGAGSGDGSDGGVPVVSPRPDDLEDEPDEQEPDEDEPDEDERDEDERGGGDDD